MKFELKKLEKHTILTIKENKITTEQAPSFKSEIVLLSKDGLNIICDLQNITYVDSSGLSSFLIADRLFKEEKLNFIFCNVTEKVKNLINLTKLDTVLTIIETIEESLDYIKFDNLEKEL